MHHLQFSFVLEMQPHIRRNTSHISEYRTLLFTHTLSADTAGILDQAFCEYACENCCRKLDMTIDCVCVVDMGLGYV